MKTTAAFTVYDAAAGAGKTYTLVRNYLTKILSDNNKSRYKQILAVTFTNKAVAEMKSRILESLHGFSQSEVPSSHKYMFVEIQETLKLNKEELQRRSNIVLHYLLHNYTAFSVQTIDKFTQSVIRTFAYDLGLATNFEVELDQQKLLEKAVDNLLAKVGLDEQLSKVVIDFAKASINDDKSWSIKRSLLETARIVFNEDDIVHIKKMSKHSFEDFDELTKELKERIVSNKKKTESLSLKMLLLFDDKNIKDCFYRNYIPNYFKKLVEKGEGTYDSKWKNEIETTPFYTVKQDESNKQIIDELRSQIVTAFLKTKNKVLDSQFVERVLKNVTQMSLLKSINDQLQELKKESQLLLISDFNKLIFETIKDQPTPFIYERLGERYKDFFIDEFQDTSVMQWQNLVPLCDNAVSSLLENEQETGTVTLVGDAKQAIYRWRGGKAEQFMKLSSGKSPFANPDKERIQLDTNYRSFSNVIEFNNAFFTFLANEFTNEAYVDLYKSGNQQKTNIQQGGYVDFSFIEAANAEEKDEAYPRKVVEKIEQIIEGGFEYKDICILVRKNQEGVVIAEYLNKMNIPVLSYEALLVRNSNEVMVLTTFIDFVQFSEDARKKLEFLKALSVYLKIEEVHNFMQQFLSLPYQDMEEALLEFDIQLDFSCFNTQPIYEAFESLIQGLKFDKVSNANLQFFMDFVFEYTQKQNLGVAQFIILWEQKKDKLSIVIPEGNNAVQIMSIHKSKGLEFPVVVYPYADTEIYKKSPGNVWFSIDDYSNLFSEAYVNYNKKVFEQLSVETKLKNKEIQELQELDNFNVLYVALTRAREQLYVISNKKENAKSSLPAGSFQSYFTSFINQSSVFEDKGGFFSIGAQEKLLKNENFKFSKNEILYITNSKEVNGIQTIVNQSSVSLTQKTSIDWGILVHELMSKIYDRNDSERVLEDFVSKRRLDEEDGEKLAEFLYEILDSDKLSGLFDVENKIYNEREFVFNNEVLRPDRVEILLDQTIVIIDYKTGEENVKNLHQIHKYGQIFEELGYSNVKKLLIYVNETAKITEI